MLIIYDCFSNLFEVLETRFIMYNIFLTVFKKLINECMPNAVLCKIQNYNEVSTECVSYEDYNIFKVLFFNLIGCYFFIWAVHGDFISVHDIFSIFFSLYW